MSQLRSLLWWLVWAGLLIVWLDTLWAHARRGNLIPAALAGVVVLLMVVLYFAEGIELAVTDLLDKHPSQIHHPATARVLVDIQQRRDFFFAQRQVFVVVIIAFTSLVTTYQCLSVPGVGIVRDGGVRFWFSLVFTTLTILWFCQVTPKRLAVINSELFLGQSRLVWRLIKLIGVVGLPNPTDFLMRPAKRYLGYHAPRHLLPSRPAYLNVATHLYGVSENAIRTEIAISATGGGRVTKTVLLLFAHGQHTRITGSLAALQGFVGTPVLKIQSLYTVPLPEQFETLAPSLDAILSGRPPRPGDGFSNDRLQDWRSTIRICIGESPDAEEPGEDDSDRRAHWVIDGDPLPESLAPAAGLGEGRTPALAVLTIRSRPSIPTAALPPSRDMMACGAKRSSLPAAGIACRSRSTPAPTPRLRRRPAW